MNALLLHGFTGDRSTWGDLTRHLGAGVRAVAVDLPGHGTAAAVEGGSAGYEKTLYSIKRELDGLDRPVVIGYSQGARLALALAVRSPGQVRGLVLESGSPGIEDEAERTGRRVADEALADRIEREGLAPFVAEWERSPLFAGIRRLPTDVQTELRRRRLAQSAAGLASALRSYGVGVQPSYWADLPHVHLPTLIVTGALDVKFTDIAARMAALMPAARHVALPDCGHAPHLEQPELYAALVRGFLRTLTSEPI